MTDSSPRSRGSTPVAPAIRKGFEEVHAPTVSSPLNPDASKSRPKPTPREQREKRDTLKKREATGGARGATPDTKVKEKHIPKADSPMRYNIPEPKLSDYEPHRDLPFVSREPVPLMLSDGQTELRRVADLAWNKKGYRYTPCIADPHFRHKQFYRQTENKPYGPRMGFEDTDRTFLFDDTATIMTNEKGWRLGRGNIVAREGRMYYEVRISRGVPAEGPPVPAGQENVPQPHIRMGWARREAPLDAPVGYDGYSYGITDIRFESVHRSRPTKIYNHIPKGKKGVKNRSMIGNQSVEYVPDDHVREGDVIGLEISLPSISLHQKVVSGIYNPAVDSDDPSQFETGAFDIIRDRIPVPYKHSIIFEQLEYQSTKSIESYSDRGPVPKIFPNPNHEDPALRSLPNSSIKVYKNGKLVGIAFENLLAFLPPASTPLVAAGARPGFDDGMLGYFPCIAAFCGGIAQVNFGPNFWYPPPELASRDADMGGLEPSSEAFPSPQLTTLRPLGDRYKEQIAEDIVWDIIDEVDFFVQDGGFSYVPTNAALDNATKTAAPKARGIVDGDDDNSFVGKF
ncbi:Ash2-trithorax family protein [Pseudovirgaria hyperparasitica]|uniref:Ash2-trithorax family protein n=1 Tax=Pseudovirgaria hyperparasitica TaxID=470096 RepID=A0A6A6VTK5_9PEZI|nr:Ash2-trithorax family protein [Pseudovirgaria hyperparasitica]KAF2752601.1 Ash2-trithorax family protein [Pseudovirgaria hyperparasitica]